MSKYFSSLALVTGTLLGFALNDPIRSLAAPCTLGCSTTSCIRVVDAEEENGYVCVKFNGPQCAKNTWHNSLGTQPGWLCQLPENDDEYDYWHCTDCSPFCPQLWHSNALNCRKCKYMGKMEKKVCYDPNPILPTH